MTQLRWRESAARARLREEEIDQERGNTGRFLVLEPMGGVGEGEEFGVGAVAENLVSHFGQEEIVAFAPEDARGDAHGFVWKFGARSKQGAIPVDHGGECAWLRPGGAGLGEILGGGGGPAAGAEKRCRADVMVVRGGKSVPRPGGRK